MDIETLTNHIKSLSKHDFDVVCKLIIEKYYHKKAINVDGKGDGGADFIELDEVGCRTSVVYQLTVQKLNITKKLIDDVKKAVTRLNAKVFFFMTTYPMSESLARQYESLFNDELQIQCTCLGPKVIAGIIKDAKLEHEFLSDVELYIPRDEYVRNIDYRGRALHSYTLLSTDAKNLREGIYDDTILMVLGEDDYLSEIEIINRVKRLLSLSDNRTETLCKRLNSLQSRGKIEKIKSDNVYKLTIDSEKDLNDRKKLYQLELSASVAAHSQLFQDKFGIDWRIDDTRSISTWLAGLYISKQFEVLDDAQVQYQLHPIFKMNRNEQKNKLYQFLNKKGVPKGEIYSIIQELLKMAAIDPLIQKVTRASIYVALEGQNPMTRAKGLGVKNWDDFDMLIDPSIAIPCICSSMYSVKNTRSEKPVQIVERAIELGIRPYITYHYINECAGHLLSALNYINIDASDEEMQYSENIFVSLYYSLRLQKKRVPDSLMEYLLHFSSQLSISRSDKKEWLRALMVDMQSKLNGAQIGFQQIKKYNTDDCHVYREYRNIVGDSTYKPLYLFNHDLWALQYLSDMEAQGEKWIFLTYDRTLLEFGKSKNCAFWIVNPMTMSEFITNTQNLSDTSLEELILFASSASERTLAVGARMIDKILEYATPEMQEWEFKEKFYKYKEEALSHSNIRNLDDVDELAKKLVKKFLQEQGLAITPKDIEVDVD